jgi:AcrR family transcriptional regulator
MISQIVEQIKSEIIIDDNGVGKASIRATARLAGVSDMALHEAFKCKENLSKLAVVLTNKGFDLQSFSLAGIPDLAVALIVEYYAFDAGKRCTEQARLVYRAFAGYGVRSWMQDITGWQVKPVAQTPAEIILIMAQQMVDVERQQRELQQSVVLLTESQKRTCDRIEVLEHEQDRFNSPCGHKYTVLGYAKKLGLDLSLASASSKGRKASSLCRSLGIEIESVNDPRFGFVGLYPQSVLAQIFGEGL